MLNAIREFRDNRANKAQDKMPVVEVAIEYVGHKWVISVRNPGQKEWVAHRAPDRKISVYNHLNEVVKSIPAIESFSSQSAAKQHCDANMPGHKLVTRNAKEIETFFDALRKAVQ